MNRLINAAITFNEPYPTCANIDFLALCFMRLLIKYAIPAIEGYAKLTMAYTMITTSGEVSFTLGPAIPLTSSEGGEVSPLGEVYAQILKMLSSHAEKYDGCEVSGLSIRVYVEGLKDKKYRTHPSDDDISVELSSLLEGEVKALNPARRISHKKVNYPSSVMTPCKRWSTEKRPFIVADTETILMNEVHIPYAAGLLIVRPG